MDAEWDNYVDRWYKAGGDKIKFVANLYDKGYIYPDVTIKDDEALFTDGIVGVKTFDWTFLIPAYRPNDWFALFAP